MRGEGKILVWKIKEGEHFWGGSGQRKQTKSNRKRRL